jgi:lysophospholipase L1-like esterase
MQVAGRARLARIGLAAGLAWLVGGLAWSGGAISVGSLALGASLGAVTLAALIFSFRTGLTAWVGSDRHIRKLIGLAVWPVAGIALHALGLWLATDVNAWERTFWGWFWLSGLAILALAWDSIGWVLHKPEFYMATVSVVLSLMLVEIGMRYWVTNLATDIQRSAYDPRISAEGNIKFVKHPYLDFMLRPNYVSADGLNRHNSLGYRGEEITRPKPDGVYRIVALGSSTTYGVGVQDWREAYPAQLERILRDEYGYKGVEVINAGVGGYTSWETLINFEMRALDLEPDMIIVYECINDVHARLVRPDAYLSDNTGYRIPWDDSVAQTWQMRIPSVTWRFVAINTRLMQAPGLARVVEQPGVPQTPTGTGVDPRLGMTPMQALESNPPIYYERNIRNLVALARANQVEVVLVTFASNPNKNDYVAAPHYQYAIAEQNEVLRAIADDTDSYLFDFAPLMPLDDVYWVEGRHLTAEGNRLKAEMIAEFLASTGALPGGEHQREATTTPEHAP